MKFNRNYIKSGLHNLSLSENNNKNATPEQKKYYKGLIVGMVGCLMSVGINFLDALPIIKENLPDDCMPLDDVIPDWASGLQ